MEHTNPTGLDTAQPKSAVWFWPLVIALTAAGALLRASYHSGRSFLGDEIGTLRLVEAPYSELLSSFRTWLSMNYFLAAEKLIVEWFGDGYWVLAALPLAAGVATIPLAAVLGRHFLGLGPGVACALLVAVHPELVDRSVEIRSYSLLVFLTLACLILFERWLVHPSWPRGILYALSTGLLLLSHPNGAYPTAAVLAISCFHAWSARRAGMPLSDVLRRIRTLWSPTAITLLLIFLAYVPILPEMREVGAGFRAPPPTSIGYLADSWAMLFGAGLWSWATLGLFLLGCWRALRTGASYRRLLVVLAAGPILMSLQGMAHYPSAMTRFLLYSVPLVVLLSVAGVDELLARFRSPRDAPDETVGGRQRSAALAVGCLLLGLSWSPDLVRLFAEQDEYPWRDLRSMVADLSGEVRIAGLHYADSLHMDPRPEGYDYSLGRVTNLRVQEDDGAAPPTSVLVARNLEFSCDGAGRAGLIGYVVIHAASARAVVKRVHDCLLDTVRGTWPVTADHVAVYDALVRLKRRLGSTNDAIRLVELREASLRLDPTFLERPPRIRAHEAKKVSERWRRVTERRSRGD